MTAAACELLRNLNLNFLKKAENIGQIPFIQNKRSNVYKSQLLQNFYPNLNKSFHSFNGIKYDDKKIRDKRKFLLLLLKFLIGCHF